MKPFIDKKYTSTLLLVCGLFVMWGLSHTLTDILNKYFQNVLNISKSQSGLVQMSYFGAYAVMSVPCGLFLKRYGYRKSVLLGLSLYTMGALLFLPAASSHSFEFFRIAIFILACGVAVLEVVAHPLIASLGPSQSSERRISFAHGLNAMGALLGPIIGGYFLLSSDKNLFSIQGLYLAFGFTAMAVAIGFFFVKVPKFHGYIERTQEHLSQHKVMHNTKKLFENRHFVYSVAAQFFNIAAQSGIWAFFINYVKEVAALSDVKGAQLFALSMAFLTLGRFIGAALTKIIPAHKLVVVAACASMVLCVIVAQGWGSVSIVALICINLFLSVLYPCIFSLGLKDLGSHMQQASSYIVLGMMGGAVFPPIMGLVANKSITAAYYLPILCYCFVFLFGYRFYKTA